LEENERKEKERLLVEEKKRHEEEERIKKEEEMIQQEATQIELDIDTIAGDTYYQSMQTPTQHPTQ
jgi:hypothetical protein